MKNAIINYKIVLKSDTCCGSGNGNGSDVDINASFDECGLPIIPAKRLRGLLREQALLLDGFDNISKEKILNLFGESGKASRLTVDTAKIEHADEISRELATEYKPNDVKSVFAVKRFNTAIDVESGTAKYGSFRTIEAVKSGTVFYGNVYINDADDTDVKIIKNSFKLLRRIGLNKTRGLGEVECSVESVEYAADSANIPDTFNSNGEYSSMDYTVTLEQNMALMLNSPMQNPDYISGALMQGAIAKYFSSKSYFNELIFDDLKIGNAYISDGSSRSFPVPMSWVMKKNEKNPAGDLANGFNKEQNIQYTAVSGYVYETENKYHKKSVKRGTDYHINKSIKQNDPDTGFYNVERLNMGQIFVGRIYGSNAALKLVKNVLSAGEISLGASISNEYGKCRISTGTINPVASKAFNKGDTIVLNFISDAVFVNDIGVNTVDINEIVDLIAGDGKIKIAGSNKNSGSIFVKTSTVGGYNAKWKMPKPQYSAITKGSVLVCECLDNVTLSGFVGIQNSEGYGEIIVDKQQDKPTITIEYTENNENATIIRMEFSAEIVNKIRDIKIKREAKEDGCVFANQIFEQKNISTSAGMRMLSLYQAMKLDGTFSLENYEAKCNSFARNNELYKLSNEVIGRFNNIFTGANLTQYFDDYLNAFLVRYKEKAQMSDNEVK